MSPRYRRMGIAVVAVVVMIAAVTAMQKPEASQATFRVVVGLKDDKPADWSGSVTVEGGEITELAGWRFEEKDTVESKTAWQCKTRNNVAPGERFGITPAGEKEPQAKQSVWPNGIVLTVKGDASLAMKFPAGDVKFKSSEVLLGEPKKFLNEQVRVERVPTTTLLRPAAAPKAVNPVEDDYPAFWVRYRTGKHYLGWVAYQKEKDRVLLAERDGPDGQWSEPLEVAGPGDHFRVALATLHDDTLWITWAEQRAKVWNLYGRSLKDGKLGEEITLSGQAGPNLWHRMTTDNKGRAWLVWQGFKDGKSAIYARCADTKGWHDTVKVSDGKANCWDPCVCHDSKEDRVWVGWDSYESGSYNVQVRSLSGGPKPKPGEVLTPLKSDVFQAHVSLACDADGRLWTAWDEGGDQWGKDTGYLYQNSPAKGLYVSRSIRVQVLADGVWKTPPSLTAALPVEMRDFHELPQLQPDKDGRMWLAFRYRTCKRPRTDNWAASGRWDVVVTACLGDHWLPPVEMPQSIGRNDMRISSQRDPQGSVYLAYASDNRPPNGGTPRNYHIAVSQVNGAPKASPAKLTDVVRPDVKPLAVHPKEKEQVARIRGYKIDQGSKAYHIYRGDLHRHTDISTDGVGDGSIMDLHRYGIDAAAMDFILIGDHNMGNDNEYNWWRTQKTNDLYTIPGAFLSMYGYERSVPYPNGHRNVIWPERGHRTLPLPQVAIPKQMADDTGKLYDYLRRTNGICTLHTSATGQGTNWEKPIDPAVEPFVEIFQGFHASFEAPGAPRIVDEKSHVIHTSYKADGYVSHALEKGYRLGFQASSDHVSTHVSYCCVLASEFSRAGLVDAMKKRHTYAATDNIVLDVRMGALGMMGDEVRMMKPGLDVVALGTSPIDRVDVIRDGKTVHTAKPDKAGDEVRFHWDEPAPTKGEKASYYYVRVLQKDGQMAWSSPIWVLTGN